MKVSELYGRHKGETVYIVGTGASMRVFPVEFLGGKLTIGLNQAWRYGQWTYCITAHPELAADYISATPAPPPTQWVIRGNRKPLRLQPDDPRFYVFDREEFKDGSRADSSVALHCGGGIHATAMALAARMGVAAIILVGVDIAALDGEHHGHDQHVQAAHVVEGVAEDGSTVAGAAMYHDKYWRRVVPVRRAIQRDMGIPVLSLTPFMGLRNVDEDFRVLKAELDLTPLPPPTVHRKRSQS